MRRTMRTMRMMNMVRAGMLVTGGDSGENDGGGDTCDTGVILDNSDKGDNSDSGFAEDDDDPERNSTNSAALLLTIFA